MIHKSIEQLNKIRCTEYEGENADALREMDLVELESLLHGTRDQEDQATDWADGVKQDVAELEEAVKEFTEVIETISHVKTALANVKRHF